MTRLTWKAGLCALAGAILALTALYMIGASDPEGVFFWGWATVGGAVGAAAGLLIGSRLFPSRRIDK